ncbi:hypothetical protein [Thermomonospora umbrina]|uniref:SH3 domain-containing protein n=1 Tax=Thermomonospora umbrina TaxID=111806 RepID=A0A3D9SKV9_9ACTN|nr:hypothetical protein [Thermomonospora umbrina]REE95040.1 hypothetical protein DFJ69_0413 [Thermomonospora umbrina]
MKGKIIALVGMCAVATGLSGGPVQASAAPGPITPASAADCENGANGFVDIPDTLSGTVRRTVHLNTETRVELQSGTIGGVTRGWGKILGHTLYGDMVWMDWTRDGGSTWIQCGPFAVGGLGQTKTTAAQRTSSSTTWRFRACGMFREFPSSLKCTTWW